MSEPGMVIARFEDLTAAEPTRLALLSDLHLATDESGTWKVFHRTPDRLRAAVEGIDCADVDAVLAVGDLTRNGRPEEFERFDELTAALDPPLIAVPGNHDLPTTFDDRPSLSVREFEARYTPGGEGYPFRARVGGVDLLALSSNRATEGGPAESWAGRVSQSSLDWLADELETADHPLVAVHHNLPGTRAVYEDLRERLPVQGRVPPFENADALVDVLAGADAAAGPVVTGHLHFPAVAEYRGVREFTLPALGSFPSAYLRLEMRPEGTTVTAHGVTAFEERVESLVHGYEKDRVLLAAAQLADCPLADDFADYA